MSISLTPLEDKIIVKQAEAETQTASGLFIPDNAKEKPQQGEVLAVGPGRRNDAGERIPGRRQGRRQGAVLQVWRHRGALSG